MEINKYIPFLKLKNGEIAALNSLKANLQMEIVPFFDFPYDAEITENVFAERTKRLVRKFHLNLRGITSFYLDNFDIDSSLEVNGEDSYLHLLNEFCGYPVIPVVSIDRSQAHNEAVLKAKQSGCIESNIVAIRLLAEDFRNFEVVEDDIDDELSAVIQVYQQIDLVLDCRVCLRLDLRALANDIASFASSFCKKYPVRNVIVTGSSIPASIAKIVPPNSVISLQRAELQIYNEVKRLLGSHNEIVLGDYTTVSPEYSEIDIPPEVMPNVMAPKVIYSHQDKHHIQRGGAIKPHPRGSLQFNDLSKVLVSEPFFRGEAYSFGESFFYEKSQFQGKGVTPGSVIKPTINAHISYMLQDWV